MALLARGNNLIRVRSEGQRRSYEGQGQKLLFCLCLKVSVFLRRDDLLRWHLPHHCPQCGSWNTVLLEFLRREFCVEN